jgi:hypothetical protein
MRRRPRGEAREPGKPALAAWKLPLIVASIALTIVGGFYAGGPGLGMAAGAAAAATIVVMAVRHPPLHPIVPAPLPDLRRHVLIVVGEPLEDSSAIEQIVAAARIEEAGRDVAEILVLTPARSSFLDRWASDFGPARNRAQRSLVVSVASLAKANLAAKARVGDEDLVQAVDDTLRSFPATEVILVTGSPQVDLAGNAAAPELRSRLRVDFRHLVLGPPGGP